MTDVRRWLILAASLTVLCLPTVAAAATTVKAKLMEQNGSGVTGSATLTATGDGGLRVVIRSRGLVPNQPHPQHIHGSAHGAHFGCPTAANDTDGDGILTNEEATGEYGTIFLALTTRGAATPQDGLDVARMPVADSKGRLNYDRTFTAELVPDSLLANLSSLHVVQHGIDVNGNDTYDLAALGVSTFAENLGVANVPEEATNPASCGVIEGASAAKPPRKGAEMGGAPVTGLNPPLAVAGLAVLLLSGAFAVSALVGLGDRRRPDDGST